MKDKFAFTIRNNMGKYYIFYVCLYHKREWTLKSS
jgi:hypothetical protein